jgi:hypothetical protein
MLFVALNHSFCFHKIIYKVNEKGVITFKQTCSKKSKSVFDLTLSGLQVVGMFRPWKSGICNNMQHRICPRNLFS